MNLGHSKSWRSMLIAAALISLAAAHYASADPWTNTASMATPRVSATATVLTNGQVLVAGGIDNGTVLATSELYNPATRTWTTVAPLMATARYRHTATLLPNGNVLVAGGDDTSLGLTTSSAELYASGTWSTTGSMTTNRTSHVAILLTNGFVLAVGGMNSSGAAIATCELYNPNMGTWSLTGSMHLPRFYHSATLLANGSVLVAGGQTDSSTYVTNAEVYTPSTGVWTNTAGMNFARAGHGAILLPNGKVLVVEGQSCSACLALTNAEIFDPANSTWTPTGSPSVRRYDESRLSTTLLPNGQVLVVGGDLGGGPPLATPYAEVYNPGPGTWSTLSSMAEYRESFSTALLINSNAVLVAGGTDGINPFSTAELYRPNASMTINLVSNRFAALTIASPVGYFHHIQYVNNITNTTWLSATNLILPTNPFVFIDYGSTSQPVRYYRDQP